MKILIYGLHFKPDLIGIGRYTGEMADWFHQHGHDIRVITAPHFYPEWKIEKRQWNYKKDRIDYDVWRCPVYVPSNPNGFTRLLHLISFAFSSIPIILKNIRWSPDYIFSIEPPFVISPITLIYAKLAGSKSILHIQDLEIDAAYSLNILKRGRFHNLIKKIEKFLLSRFDIISTISVGMKNEIIRKGINKNILTILPNWADIDRIHPDIDSSYLRNKLNIVENNIILYSGNMGVKQNLESVLNVAEKIYNKTKDVLFLMVGDGAIKKQLVKSASNRNIANIVFLPLQSEEDLGPLLTMADINLIIQDKNISDLVLPSKLTNILSAGGVSIIAANTGTQLSNLVEEYNLGYRINPNSDNELYDAIELLLNNKSICNTISQNSRNYAVQFLSKDIILADFVKYLSK
jgi:colanic acid biosynthesis glycosyl transferase WcaI